MISKNEIIEKAYELGFGDIGFTTEEIEKDIVENENEVLLRGSIG